MPNIIDTVVLVTVKAGTVEKVAKALENLEQIEKVMVVTGPYDIIALAGLPSRTQYRPFINAIHDIEGIVRTETCLAI